MDGLICADGSLRPEPPPTHALQCVCVVCYLQLPVNLDMAITSAPKTLCIRLVGNPDTDLRCIVDCFSILCILSPERLIKKVGRDVMDRDFAYIYSLIFNYLTRFNKIATQGAPQMAVDKEANSLSRVYSYYSKFNLRLFYV